MQFAQNSLLNKDEFVKFEKQFAIQILDLTNDLWFNMVHIHGEDIMFDEVSDLSVQVLNWHDRYTPPSLAQAKMKYQGVVCGGIRQIETLTLGTPASVMKEAMDAIQTTQNTKFILGTGCVTPIITPASNLRAAIHAARKYN